MIFRVGVLFVGILVEVWLWLVVPARQGRKVSQMMFDGLMLVTGLLAAGLISRSNRKQSELLNFSITGKLPRQSEDLDSPSVRHYLETRAAIIASLLARGAGEIYLATHQVPVGAEIVTRQIQNSALRNQGLWEELEPAEKELMIGADGTWTDGHRAAVIGWCEQLRLLRWTLQLDNELVPLAHQPKVDFAIAQMSRKSDSKPMRSTSDLRVERDISIAYVARVIAELTARSLLVENPERQWTKKLRENLLGQSTDYLVGSQTVADLHERELRALGLVANERAKYAGYLVDQLSSPEPLRFQDWCNAHGPK